MSAAPGLSSGTASTGAEWFVAPGGDGPGTRGAPFGRIQDGIEAAQPGDVVTVASGTYHERLRTVRGGTPAQPIVIRARDTARSAIVTASGRVLTIAHPWIAVDGLVFDGQYGAADLVRVESGGHGFALLGSEVRRTSRDAIDLDGAHDVRIEHSLVHRALNAADGRTDAHGIVAGAVRRLTIRNTEIHTFSGDGFQVDPARAPAGWDAVTIDGCRFWLAPLPAAENGFAAGTVPGENAVDTKASRAAPRARLRIRNTEAAGFRGGLINNMAAFNLKEHIDAVMDGVTVYDSEVAFRLRGPGPNGGARVRIQNAVIHSVDVAFRYEDDIETPRIYNVTLGRGVGRALLAASSPRTTLDIRNLLLLGPALPAPAQGRSNRAVPADSFENASRHVYALRAGSPALDAGEAIDGVTRDRRGVSRPQGAGYDIGAYERLLTKAAR